MEQNREPEINSHLYTQLIFDKEARAYNGVKAVFSRNGVGKIGQVHTKK